MALAAENGVAAASLNAPPVPDEMGSEHFSPYRADGKLVRHTAEDSGQDFVIGLTN
jgi:hypothetical protein